MPREMKITRSTGSRIAGVLPAKIAAGVIKFITRSLLDHPRRVGTPLRPLLARPCSARRGSVTFRCVIGEEFRTMTVAAAAHRSSADR